MAPKKDDDLNESSRTVHIHLFRLAKFVRYLKRNDAEIKLYNLPGGDSITYKAKSNTDEPSLEGLIDTALEKDPGYGRDLLSRKLTAQDTHSNKERSKGLGSTLLGITIQMKNSQTDIGSVRLKDIHYSYYLRSNFLKPLKHNSKLRKLGKGRLGKGIIDGELKDVLKGVCGSVNRFVDESKTRLIFISSSNFPLFKGYIEQLENYLCPRKNGGKRPSDIEEITNELLKLTKVYDEAIDHHDIRMGIIPGYVDCSILSSPEMAGKVLNSAYDGVVSTIIRDSPLLSPEDRLYFRYEIMHKLVERDPEEKVEDWPAVFKALLLFCNFELSLLSNLLHGHLRNELRNIRFTVLTKNSLDDKRSEKSRLTAEQLADELKNYFISDPLDEMLIKSDRQILSKPIHKYGEKEAIANHYDKFEIWSRLNQISKSILREKIISDLHMSGTFLPDDGDGVFQF